MCEEVESDADLDQQHPWVTKNGSDPLLSAEENCSNLVEPPTEQEKNHAITGNMGNLMVVMRAVRRFKRLLHRRRPHLMEGIFGRDSRLVTPPNTYQNADVREARSSDAHDRRPFEKAMAREGVHRDVNVTDDWEKLPLGVDKLVKVTDSTATGASGTPARQSSSGDASRENPVSQPEKHRTAPPRSFTFPAVDHAKGHAHNPLLDTLYLSIGPDVNANLVSDPEHMVVSESPPAVELDIYEQAYQDEMARIKAQKGKSASMYLTRFVEHRDDLREIQGVLDRPKAAAKRATEKMGDLMGTGAKGESGGLGGVGGFASMVKQAKERKNAETDARADSEQERDASAGADRSDEPAEPPVARASSNGQYSRLSTVLDLPGAFPRTPDVERSQPI